MHPQRLLNFPNVAAIVDKAVGMVDKVDAVDTVDVMEAVKAVEAVEVVDAAIATGVCAPIAQLIIILQIHAESDDKLRREETTISVFASSAGSQAMLKSITSPSNVQRRGGKCREPWLQQLSR
jgi:UDP-N-acetylglucosamine:LPS N-acetylglucosamine transferase